MTDDTRNEGLREWNRLARESTENALVSSMFEAGAKTSKPVEHFSTWLLIGTAAIASFTITNADKLLPLVGRDGFRVLGTFLCISCICGLLARVYALRCAVGLAIVQAINETFRERLKKYDEEELSVQKSAKLAGVAFETGIRMERIFSEFYAPFPRWMVWLAARRLKRDAGNPQIGYLQLVKSRTRQGLFVFVQAMTFIGFLISGFIYVSAN